MAFSRRLQGYYRSTSANIELQAQPNVYLDPNNTNFTTTGPISGTGLSVSYHGETPGLGATAERPVAAVNRALVFGDKLFWLVGNKVQSLDFVRTDRGGTGPPGFIYQNWIGEYNFADASGSQGRCTGLHTVQTSSGPVLAAAYYLPHSGIWKWRGVRYTPTGQKTGSWSETSVQELPFMTCELLSGGVKAEHVWKGRLFFTTGTGIAAYNPATQTFATYGAPTYGGNSQAPYDLCPFQGNLWHVGNTTANRSYVVSRFDENVGGFVPVVRLTGMAPSTDNNECRILMFPDDRDNRYAHLFLMIQNMNSQTNSGWANIVLSGGYDGTLALVGNRSADAGYAAPYVYTGATSPRTLWRYYLSQDKLASLNDGYAYHYLTHERTGMTGTRTTEDLWTGSGNVPTVNGFIQTGNTLEGWPGSADPEFDVSQYHSMSHVNTRVGGGERSYNVDVMDPEPRITNTAYTVYSSGSYKLCRISFNVTTNQFTPDGTTFMIAQYHSKDAHLPQTLSTLRLPSAGSTRHNDKFLRLSASANTTYTVDWDYQFDQVGELRTVSICPYITSTGVVA